MKESLIAISIAVIYILYILTQVIMRGFSIENMNVGTIEYII